MQDQHYSNRSKKFLLEKIGRLSQTEHDEIFKIIRGSEVPYTQNKNGLFVNMSALPDDVLEKMDQFVDFCLKNQSELDEYDKRISECKINNNYDVYGTKTTGIGMEEPNERKQLNEFINSTHQHQENWQNVLAEAKKDEKIASLTTMLEENADRVHKKRGNMKYVNAKKKYARKVATEKKIEHELLNILEQENYII